MRAIVKQTSQTIWLGNNLLGVLLALWVFEPYMAQGPIPMRAAAPQAISPCWQHLLLLLLLRPSVTCCCCLLWCLLTAEYSARSEQAAT